MRKNVMGRGTVTFPGPCPVTHYPIGAFGAWILSPKALDLGPSRLLILDPPLLLSVHKYLLTTPTVPAVQA